MATRILASALSAGDVIADSPNGSATAPRREVASVESVGFTTVVSFVGDTRTQFGLLQFVWKFSN
jgi:hypothetical protein